VILTISAAALTQIMH